MTVVACVVPLLWEGRHHDSGDVLDVPDAVAVMLLDSGVVEPAEAGAAAAPAAAPVDADGDADGDAGALAGMTVAELRALAGERGVTVPKRAGKQDLVALIAAADAGADDLSAG